MVIPAPASTRRPRWPPWHRSAAPRSTACRPCSSPSWPTRTSTSYDLTSLRTGIMAGSPCPVEVMKQVVAPHGHGGGHHLLRHDRDSPVSTQTAATDSLERRVSTVGQVHPHVEVKIVDPETRPDGAPGHAGRAVHPRLLGHARLLGRTRAHGRGDRRRPLHAHRRPRRHGRRGLREHHGPDQGHGDPGRREHLPARDRGVPLLPPRHPRRPGDRRARRALRRGADGVGPATPGRDPTDGRGTARVLRGQAGPLQDPPLRATSSTSSP